MELRQPTLIGVFGWPFSGKTSLANSLAEKLRIHVVDINDVRLLAIGKPYSNPNESPEKKQRDGQEMGGAYRLLFAIADWHLEMGRSLIITCTLSRKQGGQDKLRAVYEKYPRARVRFIQCVPENDANETVDTLIRKAREKEVMTPWGPYKDPVNTIERYLEVKGRYNPIELPHLKIPTWGSGNSIEDEVRLALNYILRPQVHDYPEICP